METDEEFIPQSASVVFTFHMSKTAEERPEFITLQEETTALIKTFQKDLKKKIISATKTELALLKSEIKTDFSKAYYLSTCAFLIVGDGHIPTNAHQIVNTLLDHYHKDLLKHASSDLTNCAEPIKRPMALITSWSLSPHAPYSPHQSDSLFQNQIYGS
jgi:hypothetical protein